MCVSIDTKTLPHCPQELLGNFKLLSSCEELLPDFNPQTILAPRKYSAQSFGDWQLAAAIAPSHVSVCAPSTRGKVETFSD